jgi:hypothetical protein
MLNKIQKNQSTWRLKLENKNNLNKISSFNLDSFGVLLSNAYLNIMSSDDNLGRIEEYLTAEDTLMSEEMSNSKMIELYRAITQRQKNNIHLLTQLISISNRNEQIKFLLAELTKIKEVSAEKNDVPELSDKTKAALLGIRKLMQEEYNKQYGIIPKDSDDISQE